MDGSPMLFDLPPPRPGRSPRPAAGSRSSRKQPIRDAIMAYLTEARSAKQVAGQIDRKVSVATGHLRAMRLRGLVVRVGWGQYVRTDRCDAPPDQMTIQRPNARLDLLVRAAADAVSLEDLAQLTGRKPNEVRRVAAHLEVKGVTVLAHLVSQANAET